MRWTMSQMRYIVNATLVTSYTTHFSITVRMRTVPAGRNLLLSAPINIESVVVNYGDGIILGVSPSSDTPLHNATYTRLNRIDAPELFAVHYERDEVTNQVLQQFKGHLSLLGMQFFPDLFVRKGSAHFHYPELGNVSQKITTEDP